MAEKIMKRDFIYKAVSVLIAAILWFFVAYAENPEKELWFKDISITFAGEGALMDAGFARAFVSDDKVSVKVKGTRSAIVSLSSADIIATVDLSVAKEAKTYILPVAIKFPVDGLVLADKKPYSVEVTIEEVVTKEVPVVTEIQGILGEGVKITECTPADEKIKISGGKSAIASVSSLVIRPDISGISEDKKIICPIEVKKQSGEVGKFDDIVLSKDLTEVSIKVDITKDVPVKAVFESGWESKIKASRLQSETVKISGSYEKIKDIRAIETKPVKISGRYETEKISAQLQLPEGVKVSGGTDTVVVEVTIAKEDIINE